MKRLISIHAEAKRLGLNLASWRPGRERVFRVIRVNDGTVLAHCTGLRDIERFLEGYSFGLAEGMRIPKEVSA